LKDDDDNNNNNDDKTVTANKRSEGQKKEQRKNRSLTFSFSSLNNNSLDTSPCSPPPSEPAREEAEEEEEAAKSKSSSKDPHKRELERTRASGPIQQHLGFGAQQEQTDKKTDHQTNDATKRQHQITIHSSLIIFHYPFFLKITFINSQLIKFSRKAN
jgi:hypothetical protein